MNYIFQLILLGLILAAPSLHAFSDSVYFQHYQPNHGLADSNVHSIIQDRQGFIWISTENGLNRFNGCEFTTFTHKEDDPRSLPDNYVYSLFLDSQNRLWVATINGLAFYCPESESFKNYYHDPNDPNSLCSNWILSFEEDLEGFIWMGTTKGLVKFEPHTEKFTIFQHDENNPKSISHDTISRLYIDRRGVLWAASQGGGLNQYIPSENRFIHYIHDPKDPNSIQSNNILWIYETQKGDLMLGYWNRGIQILDRDQGTFHEMPDFHDLRVTTCLEDQEGKFWYGTWDDGLYCRDSANQRSYHFKHDSSDPNSLNSDNISCLFEDRSGMIWIGTLYGGVNLCYRGFDRFEIIKDFPKSTTSRIVFSLYEDGDNLWIGAFKNGLILLDRQTHTYERYSCPDIGSDEYSDTLLSMMKDRRGILWVGSYRNGLYRFDPQKKEFLPRLAFIQEDPRELDPYRNDTIRSLVQDFDGSIWVGTDDNGLFHLKENGGLIHNYLPDSKNSHSLPHLKTTCLFLDSNQTLWIGTENGLNIYDRSQDCFIRFQTDPDDASSISHNRISCIQETEKGELWIGTVDGLNRLQRETQTFQRYYDSDGLPCNKIAGLLEDSKENLWISTNYGISQFNLQTGQFKNYDKNDGLQDNEFASRAYWKNNQGELFFGGLNGLTAFFPENISDNMNVPPLAITSFSIMGESVNVNQLQSDFHLPIQYKDKYFSFKFAALDFTNPSKNQYAYKLEGFDSDWIHCGNRRFASYTNLDPGKYTLRIKGSNNDGLWNESGIALPIVVLPPFWMTWWFRLSILLSAIAAFSCWYWMRIRKLIRMQKILHEQVEMRTQELRQKNLELKKSMEEREKAMEKIKILSGFIPICANCKKVRSDEGYWNQIEEYIAEHSEADFTHSICPECAQKLYPKLNPYNQDENKSERSISPRR